MGGLISQRLFNKDRGTYPFWKYIKAFRVRYGIGLIALIGVDFINVLLPLTLRDAIDALPGKNVSRLLWVGIFYLGLMVAQSVGRYLWRMYLIGSSHLIAQRLRIELYDHLQKLPLGFYQTVRTGDLMSRATNDIEAIRMAVGPGILVSVDAILMFLFIVPVMFYLSTKLALLAFAFYPAVPFLTARLGDHIDLLFESLQVKMSRMSSYAQESFAAVRLIKSLVLETRVSRRFRELSAEYEKEGIILAKYQAVFSPSLAFLTNLGTFLILVFGGLDVMSGLLTVGTFVAFQRFVVQLSWPMEAIGWSVSMTREGVAAERRLQQILSAPQVESTLRPFLKVPAASSPPLLEIRQLHFQYSSTALSPHFLELQGLSLERGKKVGLVGAVGSGKSTLFHLLLRLYEPAADSLFFEGRDVTSIPLQELRRRVAGVEQQIFLFSETVAANVSLGLETPLPLETLQGTAEIACLIDEIKGLDLEFETPLGERGVNLSGGQKQRLALMRALARNPQLLLLDDAFSAVDVDIEDRIIENFFFHYPHLSLCFASHRLSVMPRMDEIWLIDQGKLVDRGTHSVLMRRSGLYQSLWERSERNIERAAVEGAVIFEEVGK